MGGPEDEWYTIGVEEVLRILIPQEHIALLGTLYTYALPSPASVFWGTGPVLATEFLGSSPLSIHHQPSNPKWAPCPQPHFCEHSQCQTLPAPPPPHNVVSPALPCRQPWEREAGNLIKSLLHTTWDTVDSSNRKNFKNFQGEQAA